MTSKKQDLTRHETNIDGLYLLVGKPQRAGGDFGPMWVAPGEEIATVHVMSTHAGGEVRGYWKLRGALWHRYPLNPMGWPEVDAEVSRVLGLPINERSRPTDKGRQLRINDEPAESPRSAGDASPEPFCACGRRISECDGNRRGCRR